MEHLAARLVGALVGVGAEEIALGLQQVGGQHGTTITIVVTERGAECRHRDAGECGHRDHFAPVLLRGVENFLEERCEHQVVERGVFAVGIGDAVQEARADDAAAAPDGGDLREVEIPVLFLAHRGDEVEALGVGNDLRSVECVVDFFHERGLLRRDFRLRSLQLLAGCDAAVLHRGKDASFDCGVDGRDDDGVFDRIHDRPLAGAFLAGGVEDYIDEWLAGFRIDLLENFGGDLDQVALEIACVPIAEDAAKFGGAEACGLEDVVGFADELHVAVLDAVVDHLHIVTCAAGADVGDARFAVHFGGDAFEDRLHHIPGRSRSAGHDRGAFARAFLTAGNAGTDEAEAEVAEPLVAALGVGVKRVAAIDDDVALVEQRDELLDDRIDGSAGLDHDHDLARCGERLDEFLEAFCAHKFFARMGGDEFVGDRGRAVIHRNLEAAGFHIEHKILAHDGQSDQSEVALIHVVIAGFAGGLAV